MTKGKSEVDRLADDLKQIRDELRVQIHLAAADVRDEWEQLEKKWDGFRGRVDAIGRVAEDAAGDVGEALEQLGGELKKGYERIRNIL